MHVTSLADGIEETAVQDLVAPPGIDTPLVSAVLDVVGFVHKNVDVSPDNILTDPFWTSTTALDYAGLAPKNILRIGDSKLATSSDAGATWTLNTAAPAASGGSIAFAADASLIVWTSSAGSFLVSNGTSTAIASLPSGIAVTSDKVDPKFFYAGDETGVLVSSDGGKTFSPAARITSYGVGLLAVHPAKAGDVWYSTNTGIYHSTDFAKTFTASPGVQSGTHIAVGKGAGNETNVFAFATVNNVVALRRSVDDGATWETISDAQHGFGSANSSPLAASWETEGLVFVGTNGRGIFYGLP